MKPRIKTIFCLWPRRLVAHVETGKKPGNVEMEYTEVMTQIGWVWLQKATLYNNINHGWIASFKPNKFKLTCGTCGQFNLNELETKLNELHDLLTTKDSLKCMMCIDLLEEIQFICRKQKGRNDENKRSC